jgi:predicted component of type VI protein secretion system
MEVKLRVVGGKNAGQELEVAGPKFVIGRAEGCQLRARSDAIAERHCELEVGSALIRLQDLGSKTGTFVNNERLTGPRDLKIGDHVRVGPLEFEICMSTRLAAKKKPKVGSIGEAAARLAGSRRDDLDLDQLLGDTAEGTPSRYAAQLSDEEKEALGLKEPSSPPAAQPVAGPGGRKSPPPQQPAVDTRQVAADVLNKLNKQKHR